MRIEFPRSFDQRMYEIHYLYMRNLLQAAGCEIVEIHQPEARYMCGYFYITIDGQKFMVDYSDGGDAGECEPEVTGLPCLRFHCKERKHLVFPFPPVSFYDWGRYKNLATQWAYKPGKTVLMKQRAYCGATERRNKVREILVAHYDNELLNHQKHILGGRVEKILDTNWEDPQEDFWKKGTECAVAVCVPGANNNMLDRGQLQLMAFGVCTISPNLPEFLPPFDSRFQNLHGCYMQCKDDYSDLVDCIEWCATHRPQCVDVGRWAKTFFERSCTPEAVGKWLAQIMKEIA